MPRCTPAQREVLNRLSLVGCYIREVRSGYYELANSNKRVLGISINPRIAKRTFDSLLRGGFIEADTRMWYSRQQVGWFLKPNRSRTMDTEYIYEMERRISMLERSLSASEKRLQRLADEVSHLRLATFPLRGAHPDSGRRMPPRAGQPRMGRPRVGGVTGD